MCGNHGVMRCNHARSFPFEEEVTETKTEYKSENLSEFPHHTTYHTTIQCQAYLGASLPFGLFQLDTAKHIWVLASPSVYFNRILSSISGCQPPLWFISSGYCRAYLGVGLPYGLFQPDIVGVELCCEVSKVFDSFDSL